MEFGFFLIWLLLSAGVAGLASSRGRSAVGYFFLSFLLSPMLGLIVVLVTRNLVEEEAKETCRRREEENREFDRKREHEKQLESLRALSNVQARQSPPEAEPPATSVADELLKLANLRDKGVLTPEEFDQQKRALLRK